MAAPVWVLSVDLQTKTATFQSGMSEAARAARGAFNDIKAGSREMGSEVGGSMSEARHGVMMLGEEFGVHLPRGLTTFIASLGPVGAAMETAFPFLAIVLGATLLLEHLSKMHEAGEKLTHDQMALGTAAANALNTLDQKLLQAGIRADELHNNHLGALQKQLELIDKQSMAELVQQFDTIAKAADSVFADLKTTWYQFGAGSDGAKASLGRFGDEYKSLLSKGDDKGATALLDAKIAREEKFLALQKQAKATGGYASVAAGGSMSPEAQLKLEAAISEMKAAGVAWDDKAIAAQEVLVAKLHEQSQAQSVLSKLREKEKDNAKTSNSKEWSAEVSAAAREAAEHTQKIAELGLAAERETANTSLTLKNASIAERLESDLNLAKQERDLALQNNHNQIDALDKGGKDYNLKLKELHDKAEEIVAQYNNNIAALTGKASVEQYQRDIQALEQSERQKIEATRQGSAERIAAIDAAIKEEQNKNREDTDFYRQLLTQRTEAVRQQAEEERRLRAEAGKEAAEQSLKMGELELQAAREHQALINSGRRVSQLQLIAQELEFSEREFQLKRQAMQQEQADLDRFDKEYEIKLRAVQDKELQLVKEHENQIAAIKDRAQLQQNQQAQTAMTQFVSMMSGGFTQVLMGHRSFAAEMNSVGDQVVTGMVQNALKSMMTADMDKEKDAAKAARKMYLAGTQFPFPANIVMAPLLGAAAFASVMAFQEGGVVPGVGRGDVVPAMLEPGEGVVKNAAMEKLNRGDFGNTTHVHLRAHFAPTIHALDADGVDEVLDKHEDKFIKKFHSIARRMNR